MDILTIGRARAVFASTLPTHSRPTAAELAAAIRGTVRAYREGGGCLAEVAYAFGERPETAAARMRWALVVVADAYPARRTGRAGTGCAGTGCAA